MWPWIDDDDDDENDDDADDDDDENDDDADDDNDDDDGDNNGDDDGDNDNDDGDDDDDDDDGGDNDNDDDDDGDSIGVDNEWMMEYCNVFRTFWICRWNPLLLPLKWNRFSFTWYYFFLSSLENETFTKFWPWPLLGGWKGYQSICILTSSTSSKVERLK